MKGRAPIGTRRVQFTFPAEVAATLGYVALRLGANKSDLLVSLVAEPLEQMRAALFQVPNSLADLTDEEKETLWSGYRAMLDKAIRDAQGVESGLPAGPGVSHD